MTRKIIYSIVTSLVILFTLKASYAQDAIISQFFTVPVYVNPAFAGAHKGFNSVLNFRSHPFIDITNTSAFNGAIDAYIPSLNAGIGLLATSHYQGNMVWTNDISALFSYHLQVKDELYMNFGAQAGYHRRDYRWANLDFFDNDEPAPEQLWKHSPDFAAGIMVYNSLFYGGFAMHHLSRPNESLFDDSRLELKYTAHLGAFIEPASRRRANTLPFYYYISPNIIYQQQGPFKRFNYGLYMGVDNIMAGAWFRQDLNNSNTLIFLFGLSFGDYHLGYSYDHSLSGFTDHLHGIHEISLSWSFKSESNPAPLKCPRF